MLGAIAGGIIGSRFEHAGINEGGHPLIDRDWLFKQPGPPLFSTRQCWPSVNGLLWVGMVGARFVGIGS
jgi:hypothetical protein